MKDLIVQGNIDGMPAKLLYLYYKVRRQLHHCCIHCL